MGSSETGGRVVDCSVGSIVWVRRRNGSWWPGKILGSEELLSSHITSPRSGTPVKLLGREDASVDWYNLEKSKRVKAFRCGEFSDCIERAEAAQGMPPKKREKYARREDAILHAIELEKQSLEKKYGKSVNFSNGCNKLSPDAVTSAEFLENGGENKKDPVSVQLPECLGPSLAEKSGIDQNPCETGERNQLSGDDDSPGVLPRVRGLHDFGLQTTPPPKEVSANFHTKSRHSHPSYESGDDLNDQTLSTEIEIPVSRFEENSYPADVGDDQISGSTEDTETDTMETDSDEMTGFSDGSVSIELHPKYPRRIVTHEDHECSSDDIDELDTDSLSHSSPNGSELKGKRNHHNLKYPEVSSCHTNGRNSNSGVKPVCRYGSTAELHSSNDVAEEEQEFVDPFSVNNRHHGGVRTLMLIDVDLKVQANNYRRDVPMISLMSKLNGHAIIGHPIPIEALETGVSEPTESPTLPSVWRTARRTANSRVPRPFLSSTSNGGGMVQKGFPQFSMDRKKISKIKKSSPLSNQKVRMLSSIASGDQQLTDPKNSNRNHQVGLIKTDNLPTTITCIPVNLVFSRLHEALIGRHQ